MNKCLNCQIETKNPKFCSSSCAATFNNSVYPKRSDIAKKELAVKLRMDCSYGYRTLAKEVGAHWTTIRNWVRDIPAPLAHNISSKRSRKLIIYDKTAIRKRLLQDRENKCEVCGIFLWNEKPIILEVHHIDGDKKNNSDKNLQLLCPNCHSQTDNYRNKSRK